MRKGDKETGTKFCLQITSLKLTFHFLFLSLTLSPTEKEVYSGKSISPRREASSRRNSLAASPFRPSFHGKPVGRLSSQSCSEEVVFSSFSSICFCWFHHIVIFLSVLRCWCRLSLFCLLSRSALNFLYFFQFGGQNMNSYYFFDLCILRFRPFLKHQSKLDD